MTKLQASLKYGNQQQRYALRIVRQSFGECSIIIIRIDYRNEWRNGCRIAGRIGEQSRCRISVNNRNSKDGRNKDGCNCETNNRSNGRRASKVFIEHKRMSTNSSIHRLVFMPTSWYRFVSMMASNRQTTRSNLIVSIYDFDARQTNVLLTENDYGICNLCCGKRNKNRKKRCYLSVFRIFKKMTSGLNYFQLKNGLLYFFIFK